MKSAREAKKAHGITIAGLWWCAGGSRPLLQGLYTWPGYHPWPFALPPAQQGLGCHTMSAFLFWALNCTLAP